ncbi:hypothetical protein EDC04DRAFT_2816433 [Pisolithus marmoratus]|nr:hypothetical protein EDC04DRAFT_2816433 [Pisolithus marmoratus]
MPPSGGVKKLQKFCLTASKRGYLWAWSDTCCIDKTSSAELQEAIGSMFGWYRRSHLTIVYLADVPESGSFDSSQWFERGWTLQELLAPATVLFYTRNWSLYQNAELGIVTSHHPPRGHCLFTVWDFQSSSTRSLWRIRRVRPGPSPSRSRITLFPSSHYIVPNIAVSRPTTRRSRAVIDSESTICIV